MDSDVKNKVEYIIAVISEFAAAHSLNTLQAYRYLERFKGLDFVSRFYNVEHTLSFEDVIEDLDLVLIMSVNPGFGGQKFIEHSLKKVEKLRSMIASCGSGALIEVDGGVNVDNAPLLVKAGADALVAGSAVFNAPDPEAEIEALKSME